MSAASRAGRGRWSTVTRDVRMRWGRSVTRIVNLMCQETERHRPTPSYRRPIRRRAELAVLRECRAEFSTQGRIRGVPRLADAPDDLAHGRLDALVAVYSRTTGSSRWLGPSRSVADRRLPRASTGIGRGTRAYRRKIRCAGRRRRRDVLLRPNAELDARRRDIDLLRTQPRPTLRDRGRGSSHSSRTTRSSSGADSGRPRSWRLDVNPMDARLPASVRPTARTPDLATQACVHRRSRPNRRPGRRSAVRRATRRVTLVRAARRVGPHRPPPPPRSAESPERTHHERRRHPNNFPKLHNAAWPGVVGKGEGSEPPIDLDTMLDLTAAAEVDGIKFDGVRPLPLRCRTSTSTRPTTSSRRWPTRRRRAG